MSFILKKKKQTFQAKHLKDVSKILNSKTIDVLFKMKKKVFGHFIKH